jgi:segregation and condensation protein B
LRAEIEAIRGVQCGEILRQLIEREFVRIVGRSEELGRPLLYATTRRFLQVFGLRHLEDLPRANFMPITKPVVPQVADEASDNPELENSTQTNCSIQAEETPMKRLTTTSVMPEELRGRSLAGAVPHADSRLNRSILVASADEDDDDLDDLEDDDDDEDDDLGDEEDDLDDDDWEEVDDEEDDADDEDEDEDWEDDDDWDEDEDEDWEDDDWDEDEDEEEEEEDEE